MNNLRRMLEHRLKALPDLSVGTWKDTELVCLSFKGKDFAHFHGHDILDIRLTPKIIRDAKLSRSVSAQIHPSRSENSRWIGVAFHNEADVEQLVRLVEMACNELK